MDLNFQFTYKAPLAYIVWNEKFEITHISAHPIKSVDHLVEASPTEFKNAYPELMATLMRKLASIKHDNDGDVILKLTSPEDIRLHIHALTGIPIDPETLWCIHKDASDLPAPWEMYVYCPSCGNHDNHHVANPIATPKCAYCGEQALTFRIDYMEPDLDQTVWEIANPNIDIPDLLVKAEENFLKVPD